MTIITGSLSLLRAQARVSGSILTCLLRVHGVWVWQIPTGGPSCREGPEAEALPHGLRAREASTNRYSGTLRIEPVVDSSRGLISP